MGPIRGDDNSITGIFMIVQDATELASYEDQLIEMNIKDGPTGIYNRRFLQARLDEEYQRHKRYGIKLSLIVFDIDFLKDVNDSHGHPFGDSVLESVAAKIASNIRTNDCLSRYGRQEFCCLLPETGLAGALLLAERFRLLIEKQDFICRENRVKVTICIGVSELTAGDSAETLLKRADEALCLAKNSGKNRIVALQKAIESDGCS
jgi:diguanylate cyclase (GGDEF)-like protein